MISFGESKSSHRAIFLTHATAYVQPAFSDFERKFWNKLLPTGSAFIAARLFDPNKAFQMLQWLKLFKFLEQAIPDLKLELPAYLASANGTSNVDRQEWWIRSEEKLPYWGSACR